jgi:hypothetical protein
MDNLKLLQIIAAINPAMTFKELAAALLHK